MGSAAEKHRSLVALGESLRDRRVELEMTQYELARRCGMHRTFITGIERGESNVSILTLLRITEALETTAEDVFSTAAL